ncbi:glycoside hydrolase family 3 protein [Paenibacillus terrigena]|uniref:glycoside hydrolase family 3 protein n=1 Tax=Paenibacillus terrigena TaxID=369333 RepID=UPI00037E18DB|nr:glycoside hydrolase family 3 protein [Paenibacillus terrigena]
MRKIMLIIASVCLIVVISAMVYVQKPAWIFGQTSAQQATNINNSGHSGNPSETKSEEPSHTEPSPDPADLEIQAQLTSMTLAQKAAQMMIVDLDTLEREADQAVGSQLRKQQYAGVILFQRNLKSAEQTVKLITDLKSASTKVPIWVAIDQEGGVVTRLPWLPRFAGNMALGATGNADYAEQTGKLIGEQIESFGFNLNFAPSLDINNNPDNPVIGIRSFGSEPEEVAEMGIAMVKGLREVGMPSVVKHFPGHGDTSMDSHLGLPSIPYDRNRLDQVELVPFREAMNQGVDMMMTAHITFPKIEKKTVISKKDGAKVHIPATLSHTFLTKILREELGFEGVIVTDSLEMQAISSNFGEKEAILQAVQAGVDLLLMPPNPDASVKWLTDAVKQGVITEDRINASVARILKLKQKYGLLEAHKPASYVDQFRLAQKAMQDQEARQTELAIAEHAATLLKNQDHLLPFTINTNTTLYILGPSALLPEMQRQFSAIIAKEGQARFKKIVTLPITSGLTAAQQQQIGASDSILLVTRNLNTDKKQRDAVRKVWNQLRKAKQKAAVLAVGAPYDIRYIPDIPAFVAVYGDRATANLPAGVRTLLGLNMPTGKLPVRIPDQSGQTLFDVGSGLSYED